MKYYRRETPRFALCGLNRALCPMQLGGYYCPRPRRRRGASALPLYALCEGEKG